MYQEDRLRRLGDRRRRVAGHGHRGRAAVERQHAAAQVGAPIRTSSASSPPMPGRARASAKSSRPSRSMHSLLLYARTRPPRRLGRRGRERARAARVTVVHRLPLDLGSTRTASAASISASPTACRSRCPTTRSTGDETSDRVVLIDGAPAERTSGTGCRWARSCSATPTAITRRRRARSCPTMRRRRARPI